MPLISFKHVENSQQTRCIVCERFVASPNYVEVMHGDDVISFRYCESCRSYFVTDLDHISSYDEIMPPEFWRYYVEVNAGIDSMLSYIEFCLHKEKINSFLDVGCGFGFTVDYMTREHGALAIGLEKSSYGEAGRNNLGIMIHSKYSSEYLRNCNEKYEVVYSSEVIEHVSDPYNFLTELKYLTADDGIVIITTPNANYVNNFANVPVMHAVFSPGHHYYVLSPEQLEDLMRRAGFVNIKVVEISERLLATASISQATKTCIDARRFDRYNYIRYLENLSVSKNEMLSNAMRFRLYKEMVNAGRFEDADALWNLLSDYIGRKYELYIPYIDLNVFLKIVNIEHYARQYPFYFGVLYFYRVMHLVNSQDLGAEKSALFMNALQILQKEVVLNPAMFQESDSLIANAKFHAAKAMKSDFEWLTSDLLDWPVFWQNRFNTEVRNMSDVA